MIIPPYQAEISHPSIRGRVTALQQFMLGIGALVASWVTYGCNKNFPASTSQQWRLSLGIQIIPAGILALLIMLFPESPRYAVSAAFLSFTLNIYLVGSSIMVARRMVFAPLPNFTPMAMRMTHGCVLNSIKFKT